MGISSFAMLTKEVNTVERCFVWYSFVSKKANIVSNLGKIRARFEACLVGPVLAVLCSCVMCVQPEHMTLLLRSCAEYIFWEEIAQDGKISTGQRPVLRVLWNVLAGEPRPWFVMMLRMMDLERSTETRTAMYVPSIM